MTAIRHEALETRLSTLEAHQSARCKVVIVTSRLPWTVVSGDASASLDADGNDVRRSAEPFTTDWAAVRQRRRSGSRWIGWTGMTDRPEYDARREIDERLRAKGITALHLSHAEVAGFYHRYANGVLRSLLLELDRGEVQQSDWATYCAVNARYADAITRELHPRDLVWVHDYHLMLVPRLVRNACPWARISFMLDMPFPTVDTFVRLPQARSLIDGVLGADAIGMRGAEYVWNFLAAVNAIDARETRGSVVDDNGRDVCVFALSKA